MRHLISIADLSRDEILEMLKMALKLKEDRKKGIFEEKLKNKTLAMLFELPSTRTRISFEVAMLELGGNALYLNWNDLQLGRGEPIKDTARVMSRYVHGIMIRARKHETIVELAKFSSIPVINGLSNIEHPCQVLADLLTIYEQKGLNAKITWLGDGNNVCNSLILLSAILGLETVVACPKGYEPSLFSKVLEMNGKIRIERDPKKAVRNADVLYTDVWVSMGQEAEKEKRLRDFRGYEISEELVMLANDPIVMHCMPMHRGEEISEEVIESRNSVIYEQAENRLHMQKAILLKFLRY
ncbi:MAG: ornithine carbamoyltransferase [Archaeoglobaceae archaeon]|nr:ornithine carbamoyltransferase [Archaeoglobaceae archaeon]MDW8118432.1 ornithine carbamoyltransferase [Archaeoglobaceae archaeon]